MAKLFAADRDFVFICPFVYLPTQVTWRSLIHAKKGIYGEINHRRSWFCFSFCCFVYLPAQVMWR